MDIHIASVNYSVKTKKNKVVQSGSGK